MSEEPSAHDLENMIMAFRDLRCSSVSHMAIQDARTSLLEIQRTLQDQFLTLSIGVLTLVLTVIQTIIVTVSTDLWIRVTSLIVIVGTGFFMSGYLVVNRKTGRAAKLREVNQKIESAHDAKNEYTTLKITAEENLVPMIEFSLRNGKIDDQRHKLLKERTDATISFFDRRIEEKEKELKALEEDKKRLEADC